MNPPSRATATSPRVQERTQKAWTAFWQEPGQSRCADGAPGVWQSLTTHWASFAASLSFGTRVLDVGCGAGAVGRLILAARDDVHVTGIDFARIPLVLDPAWIKRIEAELPELPDAKKARLQSQYGLSPYDAGVLIGEQARADYYEAAAKGRDAKLTANWVTNELAAKLTAGGIEIENSPIFPGHIAELVQLIEEGVISSKIAKDVFERMWAGEGSASEIVEKQGLKQVSDTGALEAIIEALIAANPGQAEAVKAKPQAIGWFVGQVMKETGGKANPGAVNQLLRAKLGV